MPIEEGVQRGGGSGDDGVQEGLQIQGDIQGCGNLTQSDRPRYDFRQNKRIVHFFENQRDDLIRTSLCDIHSGSTKITTHLDHISHCKTTSGTNWSIGWRYRGFIISTRRD